MPPSIASDTVLLLGADRRQTLQPRISDFESPGHVRNILVNGDQMGWAPGEEIGPAALCGAVLPYGY